VGYADCAIVDGTVEVYLAQASTTVGFRFGNFEVRVKEQTLKRNGHSVAIQPLPFQMLVLLLENAGELVSREQLCGRLWDGETTVDFDNGLHVAAAKLREALRETAARPKYFRRVSGKGYQFIAVVEPILRIPPAEIPSPPPSLSEVAPPSAPEANSGSESHSRLPLIVALVALAIALVAAALWFWYRHVNTPIVSGLDKVALGGFANATGDPGLDGSLTFPFQRAMQESPYLHFVSFSPQSKATADGAANPQEELADCRAQQAQILLTGQVTARMQEFTVHLYEWKCANGHLLTHQTSVAGSPKDILSAIGTAAVKLRRRMGEPEGTLKRFNASITEGTTNSPAALRAMSLGYEKLSQGQSEEATQYFKVATDLDPDFALAYARLGALAGNRGALGLAQRYFTKAFQLRDRTTDRERLNIIGQYYTQVTGDSLQATQTYQLWSSFYPYDARPDNNLAFLYITIGQPEKAVELAEKAVQLEPENKIIYTTLAHAYQANGNFPKLDPLCKDTWLDQNDNASFHHVCFLAAFARGDQAGMAYQLRPIHGDATNIQLLEDKAWAANYRGEMEQADRLFLQAEQDADASGIDGLHADILVDQAIQEADLGMPSRARTAADRAIKQNPDSKRDLALAALVHARTGDLAEAAQLAAKAAAEAPDDTVINHVILACVRSSIELAHDDPAAAVQALDETRPYDFGSDLFLAPGYYRGLAYAREHRWNEAAAEFQRVIDHGYAFPTSPYLALSHLELARVSSVSSDLPAADREISFLRSLWARADSSYPPLLTLNAGFASKSHFDGSHR
jgi:DNA-binding winged helix-turn-helix (wHTH) protein/tetratricopeptide (TPR) repeat protein